MKVFELIEALQKCDPNRRVVGLEAGFGGLGEFTTVVQEEVAGLNYLMPPQFVDVVYLAHSSPGHIASQGRDVRGDFPSWPWFRPREDPMNEEGRILRLREKDGESLEKLEPARRYSAERILLEKISGQVMVLKNRGGPQGGCAPERTLLFGGKVSGGQGYATWPNGVEEDDPPHLKVAWTTDDGCKVCIDCHKALGLPSAEEIIAQQPEPEES